VGGVILWVSRKKPKSKSQTKVKKQIENVKENNTQTVGGVMTCVMFLAFGFLAVVWLLAFVSCLPIGSWRFLSVVSLAPEKAPAVPPLATHYP